VARALAALLLCLSAAASAADSAALGTLFHSAEERARLDRMRRGEAEPAAAPASGQASAVTGFVKRSDGRNTVWIDGSPVSVRGNQAAEVFDPRAVRAYTDRQDDALRIERRNTP
jgi:hypothetical protein